MKNTFILDSVITDDTVKKISITDMSLSELIKLKAELLGEVCIVDLEHLIEYKAQVEKKMQQYFLEDILYLKKAKYIKKKYTKKRRR